MHKISTGSLEIQYSLQTIDNILQYQILCNNMDRLEAALLCVIYSKA